MTKPAGCPRDRDGGIGPRACGYLDTCRHHNLFAVRVRRPPALARVTAALALVDDCSLDVAARTRLELDTRGRRRVLSYRRIGLRLGVSKQRTSIIADLALRHLAERLGLKVTPGVLSDLLRRQHRH